MFCVRSRWCLAGLLLGSSLWAHDVPPDWKPTRFGDAETHAPTPLPDRVVLTWDRDPATSQAVTWRTDVSVHRSMGQIALANDNSRDLDPTEVPAETMDFTSDLGDAHYHRVRFTNLLPGTLYTYRVGDGVNWSEWFHFQTAKAESAPFSFIYFGDAQNDVRMHWSRVFREAFREAPRAAFTLHAGDLINSANRDAEWGEWFGAPAWVNGTIPVIATPGNHEYARVGAGPDEDRIWTASDGSLLRVRAEIRTERDALNRVLGYQVEAVSGGQTVRLRLDSNQNLVEADAAFTQLTGYKVEQLPGRLDRSLLKDRKAEPGESRLSGHWRPQFTFPEHGPAGLEETVYYLDYQGVRIISLNSNERQEEQVGWLRAVLKNNPNRWTVATFHHPIFSPAVNRDNARLRNLWKPVFDTFKVDLVLTGHDHTYARSGDLAARGGISVGTRNVPEGYQQAYDPDIGTVYVVSVSGPKMYAIGEAEWAVRFAEDTQLFQVIHIDGDTLDYEARTATGRLYDKFSLKKRVGNPNQLIEVLPPEKRR